MPPPRRGLRRATTALRAAVAVGLVGVVGYQAAPGLASAVRHSHQYGWLLLAVGAVAANVLISAWRWQVILAAMGLHERIPVLLRAIYVSTFYNLMLPGQVGGYALRVLLMRGRTRRLALVTASVVADDGFHIVGLLGAGLVAAALAPGVDPRSPWLWGYGLPAGLTAGAMAVAMWPGSGRWARRGLARRRWLPPRLRRAAVRGLLAMARLWQRPGVVLLALVQVALLQATVALMALGMARWLGIGLPPLTLFFAATVGIVAAGAPFTLAGLGAREAALTAALHQFGVDLETAAAFAVVWLLLTTSPDLAGGLVQFWRPGAGAGAAVPVEESTAG